MSIYDYKGNEIITQSEDDTFEIHRPYWVLHLDCGRKYYSVANLKTIIDYMALKGLTQLQLHFSESSALRFALDDMVFYADDGNSYDLSTVVTSSGGGYLTQDDMDEIIVYARNKKIDIVPSFDMPGHMTNIITAFPSLSYSNSNYWTLDCTDTTAVNFGLALVEKYAKYFASRGCTYWNIGADEIGSNGAFGRWSYINGADIQDFVDFINKVAELLMNYGFTPRAFNDGALYNSNYSYLFDKRVEIYYWASSSLIGGGTVSAETLQNNNYKLINCSHSYYFIDPTNKTKNSAVENADLLKNFNGGALTYDQDGACICVWHDSGDNGDGGNSNLSSIIADIESFGKGIALTLAQLDYPII